MRSSDGQAGVEYVAVVLLVAVVVLLGGAAVGAPGIANAVGRGVRHALCVVSGGGCSTVDPSPCVVRSTALTGAVKVKLAIVRLGRDAAILRSERSDGTVDVTLLDHGSAGLEVGLGAHGRLELGEHALGTGAMAEAQLVAALGGGRTWRVRGDHAADRLVHRLEVVLAGRGASSLPVVGVALDLGQRLAGKGAHDHLPTPDVRTVDGALRGSVKAQLGPLLEIDGRLGALVGRRVSRAGTTTWLLRVTGEAGAVLASATGVSGGGSVGLSLSRDRHGRWTTLGVSAEGEAQGGVTAVAGQLGRGAAGGRELHTSATLDLTDSANRAAALGVLRALSAGRAASIGVALAGLAQAIERSGALDVATYAADRDTFGGQAEAAAGAGIGVAAEISRLRQSLLGAWYRPPGGAWERRLDCGG